MPGPGTIFMLSKSKQISLEENTSLPHPSNWFLHSLFPDISVEFLFPLQICSYYNVNIFL
jgi:hypothetical protein